MTYRDRLQIVLGILAFYALAGWLIASTPANNVPVCSECQECWAGEFAQLMRRCDGE